LGRETVLGVGGDVLQDSVADFVGGISLFRNLPLAERERLGNLLVDRLWLLNDKILQSPFEPVKLRDRLGLNSNLPGAIVKWLVQFQSDEAKVGALLIALSVQYFTRAEFDNLLTAVAERYHAARQTESRRPIEPFHTIARPLTPHTDVHSRFTRQAQIDQHQPADVPLEKFNHQSAGLLSDNSHQEAVPTPYYTLTQCIESLLNLDCIAVEDWSLSGTTITYGVGNFLRICSLLFGDPTVREELEARHHAVPRLRVVTLVATDQALTKVLPIFDVPGHRQFLADQPLVLGCQLDGNDKITEPHLPPWLRQLKQFVPSLDQACCIKAALDVFESRAGATLIAHAKAIGFPERSNWREFVRFGFNRGGWLSVGYANCPNNSLPILWFGGGTAYQPLFPRTESHHSSYQPEVLNWLKHAEENRRLLIPRVKAAVVEVVAKSPAVT
jgi:hypothetical protein